MDQVQTQSIWKKSLIQMLLLISHYQLENSLKFSSFIGKVVINDIKSTIEKVRKPVLIIFDEFSVFAGSQVLNLINQGKNLAHILLWVPNL